MSLRDHIDDPLALAFLDAADAHRAWLEGSLAQAEFEEGLHVDFAEVDALVDQDEARLAAQTGSRALPAEYSGHGYRVRIGLTALGATYIELLEGSGLSLFGVTLSAGQRVEVAVEAPMELAALTADGQPIVLR